MWNKTYISAHKIINEHRKFNKFHYLYVEYSEIVERLVWTFYFFHWLLPVLSTKNLEIIFITLCFYCYQLWSMWCNNCKWAVHLIAVKGFTLMPLEVERNQKRIEFCNKYVGYGEFCAGEIIDFFSVTLEIRWLRYLWLIIFIVEVNYENSFLFILQFFKWFVGTKLTCVKTQISLKTSVWKMLVCLLKWMSCDVVQVLNSQSLHHRCHDLVLCHYTS